MTLIDHHVAGEAWAGGSQRFGEVFDPSTGRVSGRVRLGGADEVAHAVSIAAGAQPEWAALNPQRRARVLFRFKALIEREMGEMARLLSFEHGKVIADSKGEIQRGIDVIEFACGIPHLLKGEFSPGAGPGLDVWSQREPLGVVAAVTPFNFPAMIPMWILGPALAAGNAVILKPSEKVPSVPNMLAELLAEAGLPAGVFNVIHGGREAVDALIDHPLVQAVSFVGSSDVAADIYRRAAQAGKRVQAMGGAKNHGVVMPDADLDEAVADIVGAAYGSAGERCMALPVVVPVGDRTAAELRERLVAAIAGLRVGASADSEADYGPLVTAAHRSCVESYIGLAQEEGAELVVDGRGFVLQGYEDGFFLGPTLLDRVSPEMRSYREEIFGPVLQIVRAESVDRAIELVNEHPYGNGAAIFTRDGGSARRFAQAVRAGMVGVNVPIPVPVAYHSFGGWKRSAFADHNQYGMEGVRFFTRTKVVTQRWPGSAAQAGSSFLIPTLR